MTFFSFPWLAGASLPFYLNSLLFFQSGVLGCISQHNFSYFVTLLFGSMMWDNIDSKDGGLKSYLFYLKKWYWWSWDVETLAEVHATPLFKQNFKNEWLSAQLCYFVKAYPRVIIYLFDLILIISIYFLTTNQPICWHLDSKRSDWVQTSPLAVNVYILCTVVLFLNIG